MKIVIDKKTLLSSQNVPSLIFDKFLNTLFQLDNNFLFLGINLLQIQEII